MLTRVGESFIITVYDKYSVGEAEKSSSVGVFTLRGVSAIGKDGEEGEEVAE